MTGQVNPEMLVLARELRGLTQTEVAEATSIDQGLISRYESNMRDVSPKDLAKIAEVLGYPETFFFQIGQRYGLGSSGLYHRKRQTMPATQLRHLIARINQLRLNVERLLSGVELETSYNFPQYDVKEIGDAEQIAALVRGAWRLPPGPINNLVAIIENAGAIVYTCDFGTRKSDAFVQWIPPTPPVFIVNNKIPGDRLRHTLAHEIGHLVMHAVPCDEMESEADQFAAAFLMPASDIGHDLNPVTLPHLAQMKLYWKVSVQALIRRARDLGQISERQYRTLFEYMGKLGYKTNEPNPIPLERPTLLREIIEVYLNEHKYSVSELAQLLNIKEPEFRQQYLPETSDLHIIPGGSNRR